jgi:hypothetical protein
MRAIAKTAMAHTTRIVKDNGDGTYTLESHNAMRNTKWTFKLGEQFEAELMDGKKAQVINVVFVRRWLIYEQITFTVVGDEMMENVVRDNKEHDKITFKVEGDYVVAVGVSNE